MGQLGILSHEDAFAPLTPLVIPGVAAVGIDGGFGVEPSIANSAVVVAIIVKQHVAAENARHDEQVPGDQDSTLDET